ncbi:MAG: sugar nucleotide-binding protein [Patescibacteria group bacterium]|nr:sugar nucleotide-binding protein [Patescibacteria group bacterium]
MKILIIGAGWLGRRCAESWPDAILSDKQVATVGDVLALLDEHKPDAVLNAAGVVGKPNVDWCEANQMETIKGNTILPLIIAEACQQRGVYLLHMGTGCIFYGAAPDGSAWKETDYANPVAVYTRTKYAADLCLTTLPNVGIARIRMPIDEISFEGNLINKLIRFPHVVDVENSVTIVPDMINVFRALLEKKAAGIFHVTNPGTIKHREIIAMYEELVDPKHKNEWITEQGLIDEGLAKKKRSNNFMSSTNLEKLGIHMRPIKEALRDTLIKYAENKKKM